MPLRLKIVPVCALVAAFPAHAQIRPSELASVAQTVDGTRLTVEYSRPRARGRDPLFGTPVAHWGEVWTPGANAATTLETSKDVRIEGRAVPKGKYSVWFVLRETGDWTAVLDPRDKLFHTAHPDSTAAQIRFPVHRDSGAFTEVLTWSFPVVKADGTTLAMDWGTTRVRMAVQVQPSFPLAMSEQEAAPYVGRYSYRRVGPDSVTKRTLIVTHENGLLRGETEPAHQYLKKFAFVPIAADSFAPAIFDAKGELYDVLRSELTFVFTRQGDRAVTVEIRDSDDKVRARGSRP